MKVLSPEDGKHSIVQAARKLCHAVENKERSSRDINVSMLDVMLRGTRSCFKLEDMITDGMRSRLCRPRRPHLACWMLKIG